MLNKSRCSLFNISQAMIIINHVDAMLFKMKNKCEGYNFNQITTTLLFKPAGMRPR